MTIWGFHNQKLNLTRSDEESIASFLHQVEGNNASGSYATVLHNLYFSLFIQVSMRKFHILQIISGEYIVKSSNDLTNLHHISTILLKRGNLSKNFWWNAKLINPNHLRTSSFGCNEAVVRKLIE